MVRKVTRYVAEDGTEFDNPAEAAKYEKGKVADSELERWLDAYAPSLPAPHRGTIKEALQEGFLDLQTAMGEINSINEGSIQ